MHLNATLLIEVVSFLLLVVILTKLLYKPLLSLLDKRAHDVESLLKESQRSKKEAEENLLNAKNILEKARQDIAEMKERSRIEADRLRKAILEEARKESQRLLDSSRLEIEREIEKARRSIKNDIADFSVAIAKKILSREVKIEDHAALIDKTLKELEHEVRI